MANSVRDRIIEHYQEHMVSISCATDEELYEKLFNQKYTDYYRLQAADELALRSN